MIEHRPNTAVWGDGGGSTFEATAEAIHEGLVSFEIGAVFTTEPDGGILDHVERFNKPPFNMDIKPVILPGKVKKRQTQKEQDATLQAIEDTASDNLTLMGCMNILGDAVVLELNGHTPQYPVPENLEQAQELMIPVHLGAFDFDLDKRLFKPQDTSLLRLRNTHPAPTIVSANTSGQQASRRMIDLRSRQSAQTLHGVTTGIDAGPITAINYFDIPLPLPGSDEKTMNEYAKLVFAWAQRVEKAHLPLDLDIDFKKQQVARVALNS